MTWLTKILIVLNIGAAGAFGYFAVQYFNRQQDYVRATALNDDLVWGMPLVKPAKEYEDLDDLAGLPLEEELRSSLDPRVRNSRHLLPYEDRKALFASVGGNPVASQEEEMRRMPPAFFGLVAAEADRVAKEARPAPEIVEAWGRIKPFMPANLSIFAYSPEKEAIGAKIREVLLPLAQSGKQLANLDELQNKLKATKTDEEYRAILKDAIERRLLADVLLMWQEIRERPSTKLADAAVEKVQGKAVVAMLDTLEKSLGPILPAATKLKLMDDAILAELKQQGPITDLHPDLFLDDRIAEIIVAEARKQQRVADMGFSREFLAGLIVTEQLSLADLKLIFNQRCKQALAAGKIDDKEDPAVKRRAIATVLFNVSQATNLDGKLLDENAPLRTVAITGFRAYSDTIPQYTLAFKRIMERIEKNLVDEQGSFVVGFNAQASQLKDWPNIIKREVAFHNSIDPAVKEFEKIRDARAEIHKRMKEELKAARNKTEATRAVLAQKEEYLMNSQKAKAKATEDNQVYEQQVAELEKQVKALERRIKRLR